MASGIPALDAKGFGSGLWCGCVAYRTRVRLSVFYSTPNKPRVWRFSEASMGTTRDSYFWNAPPSSPQQTDQPSLSSIILRITSHASRLPLVAQYPKPSGTDPTCRQVPFWRSKSQSSHPQCPSVRCLPGPRSCLGKVTLPDPLYQVDAVQ